MNNLVDILEKAKTYNLKVVEKNKDNIILVENRGYDLEIIFDIFKDSCIVSEYNYNCALVKQAEETTKTFEEALEIASRWC